MRSPALTFESVTRLYVAADPMHQKAALRACYEALIREEKIKRAAEAQALLFSQAETARMLNCSRYTIYRLERAGHLKPVLLTPGLKRFRREDIERLAATGVAEHEN